MFCAERDKLSSARPFHHCVERKKRRPDAHGFGDRLAVTDELEDLRGDQHNRLRMIERQAAGASPSARGGGFTSVLTTIVAIVCDTGEHYLSKFHSDEWMKEKQLLEPQKITAGLISETKGARAPEARRPSPVRW